MSEALARLLKPQIVRRCRCRELQVVRRSHQPGFCKITSSITFFWTTDVAGPVKCGASGETFHYTCAYFWALAHQRQRFVRRCHGRKKAPTIKGRGKLSRAGIGGYSALPALHQERL